MTDTDFYRTFCTRCGADESGAVSVSKELFETGDSTVMDSVDQYESTLCCANCDITEVVQTGLLPESHTENFGYEYAEAGEELELHIDGERVYYREMDENIVESALIAGGSINTSRTHHLHIHAWNPPTLSKNSAHHVEIGGYLDQEMMLVGIRYHDSKNRTLKFHRGLDSGVLNKMGEIRGGGRDGGAGF